MDQKLQIYYNEVVWCLVHFGKLSESDARQRIDASGLLTVEDEIDRMLLFHEYSYYWAMSILYGRQDRNWTTNPALWPPPEEYYEWLRNQKE